MDPAIPALETEILTTTLLSQELISMKHVPLEARLDAALSATLQSNLTSDQAVFCVNRLLSAFKEIGHAQNPGTYSNDGYLLEDDLVYN
jgi:hypothetical protein